MAIADKVTNQVYSETPRLVITNTQFSHGTLVVLRYPGNQYLFNKAEERGVQHIGENYYGGVAITKMRPMTAEWQPLFADWSLQILHPNALSPSARYFEKGRSTLMNSMRGKRLAYAVGRIADMPNLQGLVGSSDNLDLFNQTVAGLEEIAAEPFREAFQSILQREIKR